ncbi:MAG: FAD:protein FMN transferase, partial [Myxococcota bacterium]
ALRALVGWRGLHVGPGRARLARAGMEIGLGGIAKGYIADRALAVLRRAGLEAGLVNAGGDLAAFDRRSVGFPVGIERPGRPGEWFAELTLRGGGLATSASTFRRHILDPRTGRFASGDRSSTVLAASAALADAWATALQVLGDEARERVTRLRGIEALVVGPRGNPWSSPGLAGVVRWVPEGGAPGVEERPQDQEEHRRVEDERSRKLRPGE